MSKVMVNVYHTNTLTIGNSMRIHQAFQCLNPDKFTHVANVLVDDQSTELMLQEAFDITAHPDANWPNVHPADVNVTLVGYLDPVNQENRPSRGGDVFIIHGQVWVAQIFGWSHVGCLTIV